MARTATAEKLESGPAPKPVIIASLADAERALERIGELEDRIAVIEAPGRVIVRREQERAKAETDPLYAEIRQLEETLEEFAKKNRKKIFTAEQKSLELRFGKIGFRFTPWRIEFLKTFTEEKIIEKLKALKLAHAIRTVESVNKPVALALDDKTLEKAGMEKKREERFFYTLNPPESRPPATMQVEPGR